MILVDSAVWIEALRHPGSSTFRKFSELLEEEACTCGVVIQEVLQGIEEVAMREEIRKRIWMLPYLEATRDSYLAAAYLFRRYRRKGIGLHTVDALIIALAIQRAVPVFTLDEDFFRTASLESDLKLYR